MSSIKGSAAALTAAFLLLAGHAAQAETVEVKVPFSFLVRGHTLPAGQYRVSDEGTGVVAITGERGTKATMIAMTTPAEGRDPAGDKPSLMFTRGETLYRLSSIWESGTEGRTITGN